MITKKIYPSDDPKDLNFYCIVSCETPEDNRAWEQYRYYLSGIFKGIRDSSFTSGATDLERYIINNTNKLDEILYSTYGNLKLNSSTVSTIKNIANGYSKYATIDDSNRDDFIDFVCKILGKRIYFKYKIEWNKYYDTLMLSYNPLSDFKETITRQVNEGSKSTLTSSDTSNVTNQNKIRAFGGTDTNTTSNNSITNNTATSTQVGSKVDNDLTESVERSGINKYAYQDLITKEIRLNQDYNLINLIMSDIINELCLSYRSLNDESTFIDLTENFNL